MTLSSYSSAEASHSIAIVSAFLISWGWTGLKFSSSFLVSLFETTGKEKFILEFLICLSNNESRNYTKVELKPDVEMISCEYNVREHLKIPWTTIIHHTLDDLAKGTSEKKAPRCDQDIRLWGDEFGGELPELSKVSPGRKLLINLYYNTFFDVAEGGPVPGTELNLLGISTIPKPKFFVDLCHVKSDFIKNSIS